MRTVGVGTPVRGAVGAGATWVDPVKDKDLSAPPGSPATDDRYIVASGGSGLWSGHDTEIAEWDGAAWQFTTPVIAMTTYVEDETEYYSWNGSAWVQESFGPHAGTHKGGGSDVIDAATSSLAGLMSSADKAISDARITVIKTADDIEAILEAAVDGDSFWLEDGTHTTPGLITIANVKDILIAGGPGAIVTRSGSDQLFAIEGCEDFCMAGFTLSVTSDGNAVVFVDNASAGPYQFAKRHNYVGLHFEISGSSGIYSAILVGGSFVQGSIRDCIFGGDIGDCISVTGANVGGTVIVNNRMTTTADGFGSGIDVSATGDRSILIAGNQIDGPWDKGIQLGNSHGAILCNNIIRGANNGIDINAGADKAVITDNVIYDSGGFGIQCSSDHSVVQGNQIYSAAGDGIDLVAATNVHVADNVLESGAAWGIDVAASCDACSFTDNHFDGNASGELNLQGTNQHTVDGKVNNRLATTDATVTTITTIPIPDDTVVWIEANIVNRRTNAADRAKFKRGALVYREAAGAATIEGSIWTPLTIKSVIPSQWDVTISVSGNNALIQVTGLAGHDINWESRHTVEERS